MVTTQPVKLDLYGYNTMLRHIALVVVTCAPLFWAAGNWSWGWAWVYSAVSLLGWSLLNVYVAAKNPALLNQRGKRNKEMTTGAKRWDLVILTFYSLLLFAVPIVAGLDYRVGWSPEVSPAIHLLGIVLLVLGFIPLAWAMAANRFFEVAVRIQTARGHRVADNGPYRFIRHPGYLGIMLHFVAVPLAVGAWAALLPALAGVALFVLRTALEDRTLRQELSGYAAYAERTRYRLLPGLW